MIKYFLSKFDTTAKSDKTVKSDKTAKSSKSDKISNLIINYNHIDQNG